MTYLRLIRVQRFINIRITKAYRTVSSEAICVLTGLTPLAIKMKDAFQFYEFTRGSTKEGAMVDLTWGLNIGITPQK